MLVLLLTQLVYWLAHVYADLVGQRIEEGRPPRQAEGQAFDLLSRMALYPAAFFALIRTTAEQLNPPCRAGAAGGAG
jgi:hypothetical protein